MRIERDPFGRAERMHPHPKGSRRGHLGILLPERACGRVPRVGEDPLLRLAQPFVQLLERLDRQEDLASHLDHGRRVVAVQLPGDAVDRPHVRRDVLADPSVASGRGLDEDPPLIGEGAGDAVDLQLAREPRGLPDGTLHPRAPRIQLLEAERVVEREHRRAVLHGSEERRRRAADRLRRRIGGLELGEPVLELPQPAHEVVVLGVGHLGVIEHVIAVAVVLDLGPELLDAELRLRPGPFVRPGLHPAISTAPATPMRSPTTTTPPRTPGTCWR